MRTCVWFACALVIGFTYEALFLLHGLSATNRSRSAIAFSPRYVWSFSENPTTIKNDEMRNLESADKQGGLTPRPTVSLRGRGEPVIKQAISDDVMSLFSSEPDTFVGVGSSHSGRLS